VALWLAGLNHSLLIGVAAGAISFVPYLGSITGLAVATSVAIAQFWPSWSSIVVVPMIFVVGQAVADYVLSPYLVGRRVNLHPVWMIFALFAFGYLFGFVGLLLAVPLAAACRVLLRFALEQYYASPLYSARPDRGRVNRGSNATFSSSADCPSHAIAGTPIARMTRRGKSARPRCERLR
jgi:predicted PurR-regulated permease PerM